MKGTSRIFRFTTASRLPYASLFLAAAAVVVHVLPSAASTQLQYDRQAIAAGELWRVLSGHWTHVSGDHLVWSVLTFVVLGTLCERSSRVRFYACVAGAAVLIPAVLWMTLPHLATFRGLSGIDSALFALLAVTLLKGEIHARRWSWGTALSTVSFAFIAKVTYEVVTGGTIFVDSSTAHMLPVPLAHCVGAAVGMVVALTEYHAPGALGSNSTVGSTGGVTIFPATTRTSRIVSLPPSHNPTLTESSQRSAARGAVITGQQTQIVQEGSIFSSPTPLAQQTQP